VRTEEFAILMHIIRKKRSKNRPERTPLRSEMEKKGAKRVQLGRPRNCPARKKRERGDREIIYRERVSL